jgi:hypothetical protein
MKRPGRRHVRLLNRKLGLALSTAGLLMTAENALAQTCTLATGEDCTVPYQGQVFSTSPQNRTIGATVTINTDANASFLGAVEIIANGPFGEPSSGGSNGGNASPVGTLTLQNNGVFTHGLPFQLSTRNVANTLYGASIGGNGGDYTGEDGRHNGGTATGAASATVTNNAPITVSNGLTDGAPGFLVAGAALLADSIGGKGGSAKNTGPDHNNNPDFGGQTGTPGAAGSSATLTNSAMVNVGMFNGPLVSLGYWGAAARSLGGDGGAGSNGTAGGAAGTATVVNTADVDVNFAWGAATGGNAAFPPARGGFAVHARSQGGNGSQSVNSGHDGGAGGWAGAANVTVGGGGSPIIITLSTSNPTGRIFSFTDLSAAVGAVSQGGNGAQGYDHSTGGAGGSGGLVTVTVLDGVTIRGQGDQTLGVLALSRGGTGGDSGLAQDNSAAGTGGSSGWHADTSPYVTLNLTNAMVSTTGARSPGVMASTEGGLPGTALLYYQPGQPGAGGATGGSGGNTGIVQVNITGGSVATDAAGSPGVVAIARGGAGGVGGNIQTGGGTTGAGGSGGQGAPVNLTISSGTVITTRGGTFTSTGTNNGTNPASSVSIVQPSFGVLVASVGGAGGAGGDLNVDFSGTKGNGGAGGGAYNVIGTLNTGVTVTTSGAQASALVVQSLGGAGGAAAPQPAAGATSDGGNGGNGGNSGTATAINAAQLTTAGSGAHGILAQSIGGLGGNGANGAGVVPGHAGNAGAAGAPGTVNVTHTGIIRTSGVSAFGINAQSIGGGTGSGGSDDGSIVAVGGSAGTAANGGTVTVTVNPPGSISTQGVFALGVLSQSIGGGGGNGGASSGVLRSVGGDSGGGGAGGAATVTLGGGTITTLGRLAHGVVAQSIGGGGGNGGDAQTAGTEITLTVGGKGGTGGAGGAVVVNTTGGAVGTSGGNALGLIAQSIGGGGGTGGSAYAINGGAGFAASVGIGGSGGTGGAGGTATLTLAGLTINTGQGVVGGSQPTNLNPADAHGITVQSIGGGGGSGGSASAQAVAFGVPVPGSGGSSVAASVSSAVGGTGAGGGSGSTVTFNLTGGGITTQGQGSHGILLQSIGGGGGTGGDSSSMAATTSFGRATTEAGTNGFSLEIGVSLGGSSTQGGQGGAVSAGIDATTVMTLGDYGNAVVAQSIGGGGGNGGIGSSSTLAFGSTRNLNASVGLGGKAGAGGNGGEVGVTISPQAVIQTYGASALGVVAQSIGGGGGLGQGGTINLGASYAFEVGSTPPPDGPSNPTVTPSASFLLTLGATGGNGGVGGTVTGNIQGQIRTSGSDSAGVVLQSIGGGGGVVGSAGAEASTDNPIQLATKAREGLNDIIEKNAGFGFNSALTVGSSSGISGAGGSVTLNQAGTGLITTLGDWSHGVVAQSIGGGGGMAGAAASTSSIIGLNLNMALGGTVATGGSGGTVTVVFDAGSTIRTGNTTATGTTGYGAFGVLAQSVGGGGGTAVDGSTGSQLRMFVGAQSNGSGALSGHGGTVTARGTVSITTLGMAAVGMALQSIGAGGGVGGSGNFASSGTATGAGFANVQVGGLRGAWGDGGVVLVDNATLNIATSGAHAYGLLAQSIGGGGGFGFTANNAASISNAVGASLPEGISVGNGNSVTLNLVGGGIQTGGLGAHGIIAQSIGGGGGIAGLPTGAGGITTLAYGAYRGGSNPSGAAGTVSITSSTPITTTGDFAYGILAQSIGGGGGLQADGNQVLVGSTNSAAAPVPSGASGSVTIRQNAVITATGANSVGIFAQSVGVFNSGAVQVYVAAAVQGGSGAQGYGIWSDSINTASTVQIEAGGSVSALSGNAIRTTAGNTVNAGLVTGSYALAGGGRFINSGTLNAGPSLVAAQLDNSGTVRIAAHVTHGASAVSGDFVQRGGGRLLLDADFGNRRSDVMNVAGAADLSGRVRPLISSVLPNVELPFLVVNGPVTGTLEGEQTSVFAYDVNRKGGSFSVSARADFTPAGYGLSRNIAAVAGHMQAAWDAGGAGLGPLFALLGNTADAGGEGAYGATLRQISPNGGLAPGARLAAGARGFANAAMSCPQFEGSTAMLTEGECVWAGLTGRTTAQAASDGLSSFRLNSTTWQAGGQRAMGGGWFLGGSIAYEASRLTTTEGLNSGRGQAGFAAVTTKYQTGPWLFAGAVFGGGGEFNSTRTITLPGFGAIARGSPTLSNAGAMLRGTYTFGGEEFYLRPSMTLSLVHARSGAYRESGAGVLNLEVSSASSTVAGLTPALEVGGRATLSNGMVLRLYTSAGVSLLSEGGWRQEARLVSSAAQAGRFSSVVRTDQVVGRVAAGMQVFATNRLELRLQYEGEYSTNLTGHGGSFAVAYRF